MQSLVGSPCISPVLGVLLPARAGSVQQSCFRTAGDRERSGRRAVCGHATCSSTTGWANIEGGGCADCGVTRTGNEVFCVICRGTWGPGNGWKHLGASFVRTPPHGLGSSEKLVSVCRLVLLGVPSRRWRTCAGPVIVSMRLSICNGRGQLKRNAPLAVRAVQVYTGIVGGRPLRSTSCFFRPLEWQKPTDALKKRKSSSPQREIHATRVTWSSTTNFKVMLPARYPTAEEVLEVPVGPPRSQDSARAKDDFKRHVDSRLAVGEAVCSDDIEEMLLTKRRANNFVNDSAGYVRKVVLRMLKGINEGIEDTRNREYDGSYFGEDGHGTFVYLIPAAEVGDETTSALCNALSTVKGRSTVTWLRVFTCHWHTLLHSAKVLLRQYWVVVPCTSLKNLMKST